VETLGIASLLQQSMAHYHPDHNLEQFFYSHLKYTRKTDADQVVLRQTAENAPGGAKMIMVGQLWLCMWIKHKKPAATVD
jgi:hypothetical protein